MSIFDILISHNAITRGVKCSFSVTIQILLNHTLLLRLLHYAKYAANKREINYAQVCIVHGQFEKRPAFRHDCTPTWEPSLALLQTFTINTLNDTPRHHQEWRFPRIGKKIFKKHYKYLSQQYWYNWKQNRYTAAKK